MARRRWMLDWNERVRPGARARLAHVNEVLGTSATEAKPPATTTATNSDQWRRIGWRKALVDIP